jgi:type I restriction enzyme S subunit
VSVKWPMVPLGEVMVESREGHAVRRDQVYPNFGIYSFGRGLFAKPQINGMATSANTLYRARAGQFVYSRLFAFEGAYGFVPQELDGHFVSNEFPLFDCNTDRLHSEFLSRYLSIPRIWAEIASGSVGMGDADNEFSQNVC